MKKYIFTVFFIVSGCILFLSGTWIYFQKTLEKVDLNDGEKVRAYEKYYLMISNDRDKDMWQSIYKNAAITAKDKSAYVELLSPDKRSGNTQEDCLRIGIASNVDGIILEADGSEELITAAAIANRTIGCVNAPSLMQKVIAKCVDAEVDVAAYDKNRLALYNGLKECGFECIKPQGAFYLFVKSPVADEKAFCEAGKKYNILMVPGSSFACPGYVRLAYCVSYDTIINSLPEFKKLAEEFGM